MSKSTARGVRIKLQDFRIATVTGESITRTEAATSYLVGVKIRKQRRSSFIVELQHNGTGYSSGEFRDFVSLVNSAAQPGADGALMARVLKLVGGGFGQATAMEDYL